MYFFDYNCKSDFNFIVNNFAFQKNFFVMLIIFFGLKFKNIKCFQKIFYYFKILFL